MMIGPLSVLSIALVMSSWAPVAWAEDLDSESRIVALAVAMPGLNREKRVLVYLPPGYHSDPGRRFPVIYMLDGQDLFDAPLHRNNDPYIDEAVMTELRRQWLRYGSWRVDRQLDRLHAERKSSGVIVVGVASDGGNRTAEYSPWPWADASHPQGDRTVTFLVETLKPLIDARFRTLPGRGHTAIAGSSMGGVLALYAGLRRPDVFARVGAFSPLLSQRVFGNRLREYLAGYHKAREMRIYADLGRGEASFGPLAPIYDALLGAGFGVKELWFREGVRGHHQMAYWGQRFPVALLWLMSS